MALGGLIVVAGIAGPGWSAAAAPLRFVGGIAIGIAGWLLVAGGLVGLGNSLTPFPKPSKRSTLRTGGAYRLVRHPIYGGSILVALGWSLISSPLALLLTGSLAVVVELKSRHEESMLETR